MKKFTKKITAIVGTATLAVGLIALPALAGTTQERSSEWVGQMQNFMQQTFIPEQHQVLMNSSTMQNLHNSAAMQQVMQTGGVKGMQDLMNSDQAVKAQIGQDNLNKMNQFMSQYRSDMMNGSNAVNSGNVIINGSGSSTAGMMDF